MPGRRSRKTRSSSDAGGESSSSAAASPERRSRASTIEATPAPRAVADARAAKAASATASTAKSSSPTATGSARTTPARSSSSSGAMTPPPVLTILTVLAIAVAIGLHVFDVADPTGSITYNAHSRRAAVPVRNPTAVMDPSAAVLAGLDAGVAAEYLAKLRAAADEHAAGCGVGHGASRTAAFPIEPDNARERRQINYAAYYTTRETVPWYTCDTTTCKLPNCQCAQNRPPAGLDPSQVPQFITITFDDAVNAVTYAPTTQLLQGIKNPDGCEAKGTYYVSAQYTDWHAVQTLYAAGHEIADHTFSHVAPSTKAEISNLAASLGALSMIPRNAIQGFRAPYLNITTTAIDTIRALNFSYDSSMTVTPVADKTLWPFTLDAGLPVTCAVGDCTEAIPKPDGTPSKWSAPGVWELPMYSLVTPDGNDYAVMDPPLSGANLTELLERSFDLHYNGSRAPFGLYLHAGWLLGDPTRSDTVRAFLDKMRKRGNVYVVSNAQMLAWLRNPQPITSSTSAGLTCPGLTTRGAEVCDGLDNDGNGVADDGVLRTCNFPDAVFGTCAAGCPVRVPSATEPVPPLTDPGTGKCMVPTGTCANGTWDETKCLCMCTGTLDGAGWCRDALGSCSVAKTVAADGKYVRCAYDPAPDATASSTTTTKAAGAQTTTGTNSAGTGGTLNSASTGGSGKDSKDSTKGNAAVRKADTVRGVSAVVVAAVAAVVLAVVVDAL
ncbi:hypothetical protein GGF32_000467 [Allomyces javanicus]|nr:hypothetical protein GGF32_000467 [Allomyces javanicus]